MEHFFGGTVQSGVPDYDSPPPNWESTPFEPYADYAVDDPVEEQLPSWFKRLYFGYGFNDMRVHDLSFKRQEYRNAHEQRRYAGVPRAAYSAGWVDSWDSSTTTPDPWQIDGADDRIYIRDFDLGGPFVSYGNMRHGEPVHGGSHQYRPSPDNPDRDPLIDPNDMSRSAREYPTLQNDNDEGGIVFHRITGGDWLNYTVEVSANAELAAVLRGKNSLPKPSEGHQNRVAEIRFFTASEDADPNVTEPPANRFGKFTLMEDTGWQTVGAELPDHSTDFFELAANTTYRMEVRFLQGGGQNVYKVNWIEFMVGGQE